MTFWSYIKNGLIRKISLVSKSMTSQPGQQTIAIHILFNISGSKGNQAMKFGEFIEYNMRNIFVEKSSTKFSILSILSNSKLSISLDQ